MKPAGVLLLAYLLGSIPFGYLIVRLTAGADIRTSGSGGTGATNVSRRAGKTAGIITLLLDSLKGAAAVLIAIWAFRVQLRTGSPVAHWWIAGASLVVLLGHIFPVWLGFRGGKGVATAVGVLLVLAPVSLVLAGLLFLLIVWRTRYVSLGSIVAAASLPVLILIQQLFGLLTNVAPLMFVAIAGAALIIFAHRANIHRLLARKETKFK